MNKSGSEALALFHCAFIFSVHWNMYIQD